MGSALKSMYATSVRFGFDPRKTVAMIKGTRRIARERKAFNDQRTQSDHPEWFPLGSNWPIPFERGDSAGTAKGHYFHQDLFVAREIHRRNPIRHIDVGSRVDGFVAHVAAFRDIDVVDIRPLRSDVSGITFIQADLLQGAPPDLVADSVSCLHALEHFGLGRYGDPIDYDGWLGGLSALTAMVQQGGTLYLSVPTGIQQRVEFNAHRVFSLPFLRDKLLADYSVQSLAFVDDSGDLHVDLDAWSADAERSYGATYGCSIWVLEKA